MDKDKGGKSISFWHVTVSVLAILSIVFILSKTDDRVKDLNLGLINPVLNYRDIDGESLVVTFSEDLNKEVDDLKKQYNVNHVSLYFRDLNNGVWVGISEEEEFVPASLLKVPILMALLKYSEAFPTFLDKKVTITKEDVGDFFPNLISAPPITPGQVYSNIDLAEIMIVNSDNIALRALSRELNSEDIKNAFNIIGVPYVGSDTEINVRVKDYAGFFRVLFNASYLNREMSERALQILSKSKYTGGLVAGVPEGVVVAHKFGERGKPIGEKESSSINQDEIQLHDCGIIYYPENPYLLCIMTRGSDFINQEQVIRELSRYIYDKVDVSK